MFLFITINFRTKMKRLAFSLLFSAILLSVFSCRRTTSALPYRSEKSTVADSAMVVSPHPLASEVGIEIMRQGGGAVDAAIAVQFALAVVYPRAGNIGGGGFMVIRNNDGSTAALDYREKAPLPADRDMYLDSAGNVIDGLSRDGHLAVGVPGTVDGLFTAHERFGKLEMRNLIEPAIRLARSGFPISGAEADRLNRYQ
jgi:gamma-glutamyltranspeptidase / glutathione hydrolase